MSWVSRQKFFITVLLVGLFVAFIGCEMRHSETTTPTGDVVVPPWSFQAVPVHLQVNERNQINQYRVLLKAPQAVVIDRAVLRAKGSITAKTEIVGMIPAGQLEFLDEKTTPGDTYYYFVKDEGPFEVIVPRDVAIGGCYRADQNSPLRVGRLFLEADAFLESRGEEVRIAAEEIIAMKGSAMGVSCPESVATIPQAYWPMKATGVYRVFSRKAQGSLRVVPDYPVFLLNDDSTPKANNRVLEPKKGSQEMRFFVAENSPLHVQAEMARAEVLTKEQWEVKRFSARPISLAIGSLHSVLCGDRFVNVGDVAGIYRVYRVGVNQEGLYYLVSPDGFLSSLIDNKGAGTRFGEGYFYGKLATIECPLRPDASGIEGIQFAPPGPPGPQYSYPPGPIKKLAPQDGGAEVALAVGDLLSRGVALQRLLAPKGISVQVISGGERAGAERDLIVSTSLFALVDELTKNPEPMLQYLEAHHLTSVRFTMANEPNILIEGAALTFSSGILQPPAEVQKALRDQVPFRIVTID